MKSLNVSAVVDGLLEGKDLDTLIQNPNKVNLIGAKIQGLTCPSCNGTDMEVCSVLDESEDSVTVLVKCCGCNEPSELELVPAGNFNPSITEGILNFEGKVYEPLTEGIMNGNYLKFNNGVKAFITKDATGDNYISFEEPAEGDFTPLNTKVTFKVISFRNGFAKIISMVNDNSGKLAAGTIFYVSKEDLQSQAKVSKPKQNPSMDGKFKY